MMQAQTAIGFATGSGVTVVIRGHFPAPVAIPLIETLLGLGIRSFELTMNSTEPLETMQAAKRAVGDAAAVGMGTVLDADAAHRAVDAGADFLVAPSFSRETIAVAHEADVLMVPGVMTPTEAVDAHTAGARLVKLFPAGALGVGYFSMLRGPLDHIPFMCNGGITDANAGDFIRAGALACGVSGWLTGDGTWPLDTVRERGARLLDVIRAARE